MGWSLGWDNQHKRDIGYGVPAFCDHPDCDEKIDRGLAHVCCKQDPYGGDEGCGLFFCSKHHDWEGKCERCAAWDEEAEDGPPPFDPKPDHPEWLRFKMQDPSWAQWRITELAEVAKVVAALGVPCDHRWISLGPDSRWCARCEMASERKGVARRWSDVGFCEDPRLSLGGAA